jgi:hypothetical protein
MKNMRIDKQDYEILGECIVTDQVPASLMADYFTDERFKKWYMKRYEFKRTRKKGRKHR